MSSIRYSLVKFEENKIRYVYNLKSVIIHIDGEYDCNISPHLCQELIHTDSFRYFIIHL